MSELEQSVYIGIHGSVISLDRLSGTERWRTSLKGCDFVNLTLDGDQIIASTKGEIFCLDARTGAVRWANELPGMGRGITTVVTALSPSSSVAPSRQKQFSNEQAASAGATAAVIAST
jgi:outer membrane protein assembly factor BamB